MYNIEHEFMPKYFGKLPNECQLKIMLTINHWKIPPKPKFRIYQNVKYKKEYIEKIKKSLKNSKYKSNGEMPFGKLIIDEHPYWCMKTKKWNYNYIYGFCGTHEGHAIEEDIEEYK